jgi:hypothetical protein
MTDTMQQAAKMRGAFDKIEESYEFMLAYAAQGRRSEVTESGGESQIRQYLKRFEAALSDLGTELDGGLGVAEDAAFVERAKEDVAVARSVIALLLGRPSISSEMIDNTNGLIAMRALLTDIFYMDQVALPPR